MPMTRTANGYEAACTTVQDFGLWVYVELGLLGLTAYFGVLKVGGCGMGLTEAEPMPTRLYRSSKVEPRFGALASLLT